MADSRILHRRAGDSEKLASLTDFEFRVWAQYVISADDFGVMPALAVTLQSDNRALRKRPAGTVQKGLEAVIASGLILAFVHQGERYVWQHDWQDWQGIRYPRATVRPLPNDTRAATAKTAKLFCEHASRLKEYSGDSDETSPIPTGAGGRETLTHTQTPTQAQTQTPEGSVRETKPANNDGGSWRKRGRTPGLLQSPIAHEKCYQSPGCGRGLCVPPFLATEWLGQSEGDAAYVDQFIATTLTFTPNGPQGDPVKWWRAKWDEKHRAPSVSTKSSRTIAAGLSLDEKLAAGAKIDPFGTVASGHALPAKVGT